MKKYSSLFVIATLCYALNAQSPQNAPGDIEIITNGFSIEQLNVASDILSRYETFTTGINTDYSEHGVALFRDKFISYSSRKIGAINKKDPVTNEPFAKLYCSDVLEDYDLTRPLLFSSILNSFSKNENLGTLTFSLDGNTVFFTKSTEENSQHFQMFSADMDPEEQGRWMNIQPVSFNDAKYSFETPHLSRDGKLMYFAANLPSSKGGFDIYQVPVLEDGSFGTIEPVPGDVNTEADEKFPYTSIDGKFLFFSSTGHQSHGGYDVFKSRKSKDPEEGYKLIINLGPDINGEKDEVAFIPATDRIAYITSDRDGGLGRYDIYKVIEYTISQTLTGKALDFETSIPLANTTVRLIDTDGEEVATVVSDKDGRYEFPISSLEYYTIVADKDGFQKGITFFNTDNSTPEYEVDVMLRAKPAEIVETEEKTYIKIENIQFDFDSARIKDVSTIQLNKVVSTMTEHPNIKVALNAHTDHRGSDGYNLRLSQRRAESAVAYLLSKGIAKDRLIATGYGETQPIYDCIDCTEEQFEQNRRVEFIIMDEDQ